MKKIKRSSPIKKATLPSITKKAAKTKAEPKPFSERLSALKKKVSSDDKPKNTRQDWRDKREQERQERNERYRQQKEDREQQHTDREEARQRRLEERNKDKESDEDERKNPSEKKERERPKTLKELRQQREKERQKKLDPKQRTRHPDDKTEEIKDERKDLRQRKPRPKPKTEPDSIHGDFVLIDVLGVLDWRPLSRSPRIKVFEAALIDEGIDPEPIKRQFGIKLAKALVLRVENTIRSQRFRPRLQPLSRAYARQKRRTGGHPGFWINTGYLVRNIRSWVDRAGNIFVGFPQRLRHHSNGQRLAMIAKALEEGVPSKNLPARPVFKPAAQALVRDSTRLFERHLQQTSPKLLKIWRESK